MVPFPVRIALLPPPPPPPPQLSTGKFPPPPPAISQFTVIATFGLVSLSIDVTALVHAIPHEPDWHAPVAHATSLPHCPHELHVCVPAPSMEHRIEPGVHAGAEGHEQLPQAQLEVHVCVP
jgi:hypothetical protein